MMNLPKHPTLDDALKADETLEDAIRADDTISNQCKTALLMILDGARERERKPV